MNREIIFDKFLMRQLNRFGLSREKVPTNIDEWKNFLENVSRAYMQNTQDRYLLERSLSLASSEMAELNEKIENAQSIAKLGYWYYDTTTDKIQWSNEIYKMFGIDYNNEIPSYDDMMKDFVHPSDLAGLHDLVQKSLLVGEDYESEIRILNKSTNEYKWFNVKGHPHKSTEANEKYQVITGIIRDITKDKENEIKIKELHQQLVSSARTAGMAEMATSMLHNIGNVLNSVNVSAGLIVENFDRLKIDKLRKAVEMMKDHLPDLAHYLSTDPKGRLLLPFFEASIIKLESEHAEINKEIKNIIVYVNHMKDIIKKQQKLAKNTATLKDFFSIDDILNDAIQLTLGSSGLYDVQKEMNIDGNIKILGESYKVAQILINLIRNAADSLIETNNNKIKIAVNSVAENIIEISIKDSGIGIEEDNLKKIFNFGFTTKKEGHGFGLHNSALMAKEMGGNLFAESKGLNQGSTFKLQIPINMRAPE